MLLSVADDERAALQFDDLASALDAGLPLPSIGGDPADGPRVLHRLLQRRGVVFRGPEDAVLAAAWQAGRAPKVLRSTAEARRQRAQLSRQIWQGIRYPLALVLLVTVASVVVGGAFRSWSMFLALVGLEVALVAMGIWMVHRFRTGSEQVLAWPLLGELVRGLGELPYLESLHALYGAGVPLVQAHGTAVAAVHVAGVQARLVLTHRGLTSGRRLGEALQDTVALHPETRTLLTTGELAGQLEEALQRALVRRREVTGRRIADLCRWAGHAGYALAVIACVSYIFWVYSTIFRRLHGG